MSPAWVVVCACGALSDPSDVVDDLDGWEDDHTQHDCTHVDPGEWDEHIGVRRFPALPAMTRYEVDLPTPARDTPITPARRPQTGRRRTHWRPA
ncbi:MULTISPECIES: hypothetical protein [Prauserella salsuginis group]|uniref:Uncharacterized protein n=2 Tax=Prauserella salsuginis group TaxID=2893672 RepID=A0A839XT38_9PSEU|nr:MULTISPECIES: hypothetical protein [Prauserella salsuginis group]MBB3666370.1 hypothetical protein [Prauserella sediminis]MCR3719159.1 hypothetical protein [Prauserella flava]MCR3735828.1 hypothetical protein [Prauserella salsuginis]